jgi:hypothetical protein
MTNLTATALVLGVISAVASAQDLSKYRDFQLGADVPTVASHAGMDPSQAKVIHSRPSLIQELTWRPRPLGLSTHAEEVSDVVFSFYNGELFRIAVNYDRHETAGLTPDDLVEAISAVYGTSARPAAPVKLQAPSYGEQDEIIAQWRDPQYAFTLIKSSLGPEFKLVGVLKKLEEPAQSASIEAARLDAQGAPQREADRVIKENDADRARLEQARLVNKPKFRP